MSTTSRSTVRELLHAIEQEQVIAYEALAVVRVIEGVRSDCPNVFQGNDFLWAMYSLASDHLLMTVARLLDRNKDSASVCGFCRHAEQNVTGFDWLWSDAGTRQFPEGREAISQLSKKWIDWSLGHPLSKDVRTLRDKVLAHRDKAVLLNEEELPRLPLKAIEVVLYDVGLLIDEFLLFVENGQFEGRYLYERVCDSGIFMNAVAEAALVSIKESKTEGDVIRHHRKTISSRLKDSIKG